MVGKQIGALTRHHGVLYRNRSSSVQSLVLPEAPVSSWVFAAVTAADGTRGAVERRLAGAVAPTAAAVGGLRRGAGAAAAAARTPAAGA